MWGCSALRTPLSRGTHFMVVPAPCTEDEVLSARLRASVAVVTSIRASIRALAGESPEVLSAPNPSGRPGSARQWHWDLGLRLGTWVRARVPPDLDPEGWLSRVQVGTGSGWGRSPGSQMQSTNGWPKAVRGPHLLFFPAFSSPSLLFLLDTIGPLSTPHV